MIMRSVILSLLFAAAWTGATWAQSPIAQQVGDQITQILQQSGAASARSSAMARDLSDRQGSVQIVQKADQSARLYVISTVVGAIATDAAHTGDIIVAAINAAPELRDDILGAAATNYPAFAPVIYRAAGSTPPVFVPAPRAPTATFVVALAPESPSQQFDEPAQGEVRGAAAIRDPLEGFNRGVFAFNDVLDRFLLRPIAYAYGYVTPSPVKQSVRNFFSNLAGPVRFANDLIQLDGRGALTTGSRFVVNSTVGVLGFFEVADRLGMPHHPADFGQTLNRYGVGSGPYIVIPVLGPSTVRDGFGLVADNFLDPLTYILEPYPRLAVGLTKGIVAREALIQPLDELRAGSVDYYAALRAAYFQGRAVTLAKGRAPEKSAADDAFGSFE